MRPQRYRKKPSSQLALSDGIAARLWLGLGHEVEAMQITPETFQEVGRWAGADYCFDLDTPYPGLVFEECKAYCIKTTKAGLGDYIIRGDGPEFYICKPDLFERVFDLIPKWRIEKTLGGWAVYEPDGKCSGSFEDWADARDWATGIAVRIEYWMEAETR